MRPLRTVAVLAAVVALAAAGCGRSGSTSSASATAPAKATQTGDFGNLTGVCRSGKATGATDQGVTASQITVGVLTDEGYTKIPDLANAAHVFTTWCNAAGGIDGRKVVANIGDTDLLAVVPAMAAACSKDFVLAGNSEALDGLAVKTRVSCLLPEFPAQVVMPQDINASLQAYPLTDGHSYGPYAGYYSWLVKQAYLVRRTTSASSTASRPSPLRSSRRKRIPSSPRGAGSWPTTPRSRPPASPTGRRTPRPSRARASKG